MPWVLVVAAVVLALYAAQIRRHSATNSIVTVKAPDATTKLMTQKVTTTRSAASDTLVGILLGTSVVLLICGTFYARVSKVTLPGGAAIEMAAAVGNAVGEAVKRRISEEPEFAAQASSPEGVVEIATKAATATAVAQQQAFRGIVFPAEELSKMQRGMPMSDEFIEKLAESAVDKVFKL